MNNETRSAVVRADLDGLRLDRALSEIFPDLSRSFLAKLIDLWDAVCQLLHRREPKLMSSGFFFAFALPIIPLFVLAFTLWLIG